MQMIGGFLHPGKPMANMYFVLFGYSELTVAPSTIQRLMTAIDSVTQAQLLMRDLKIAQC